MFLQSQFEFIVVGMFPGTMFALYVPIVNEGKVKTGSDLHAVFIFNFCVEYYINLIKEICLHLEIITAYWIHVVNKVLNSTLKPANASLKQHHLVSQADY